MTEKLASGFAQLSSSTSGMPVESGTRTTSGESPPCRIGAFAASGMNLPIVDGSNGPSRAVEMTLQARMGVESFR